MEAETKSDSSLEHVGSLAETGDGVEEDVLVQYAYHSVGDSNQGMVVPTGRSHQVSTLAPVADIYRVATMNEEESVCETPPGLTLTVGKEEFVPSVPDQAEVDKVVDECVVVPSSEFVRTDALMLSISMGVHEPVSNHPYRIPHRRKEEVRLQLDQLPTAKMQAKQIVSLHGCNSRFVPEPAEHSLELSEAIRKSAPERTLLTECMYSVWYYFKDFMSALPSLTLPVPSVQCVSQTDASGAVLSVTRDGKEWPVTFYFREWQPWEHHKALVVLNPTQPSNGRLAK